MSVSFVDAANVVRLLVNGIEYGGWKSVHISAGIERQARDFELEVTDRWPGQAEIPRRIQPGDPCQVFVGDDLIITGYVDATPIRYDGKSVSVGVKGRSKTADLVDCCPLNLARALPPHQVAASGKMSSGRMVRSRTSSSRRQQR